VTGLVAILLQPQEVEGTLLCLFSAFLLFDSGWFVRRTALMAGVVASLVVLAQVASLVLGPGPLGVQVLRLVVTDGLFAVLVVMFYQDMIPRSPQVDRPVLLLAGYGITDQEQLILQKYWDGLSSKEIAADVNKAPDAIRAALSRIYRKLGLASGKDLLTLGHSHQVVFGETGEDQSDVTRRVNR